MSALAKLYLFRKMTGFALVLAAGILLTKMLWHDMGFTSPQLGGALTGGMIAAAATALGALPILLSQTLSSRTQDTLFGFGAGVMLAACAFSLVVPGINAAKLQGAGAWSASLMVGGGILLGGALLLLIDKLVPHEHFIKGVEGPQANTLRRTWLFVFAIALHNLPEGLAIGVAYAGTDTLHASALTMGIAIQDIPEGLIVSAALVAVGYSRLKSVTLGILSGIVEPIAAVFGALVVSLSATLLPWSLGFAAGAMLFVISHEIIPESHRKGHELFATTGLLVGFVIMMTLDTALG